MITTDKSNFPLNENKNNIESTISNSTNNVEKFNSRINYNTENNDGLNVKNNSLERQKDAVNLPPNNENYPFVMAVKCNKCGNLFHIDGDQYFILTGEIEDCHGSFIGKHQCKTTICKKCMISLIKEKTNLQ